MPQLPAPFPERSAPFLAVIDRGRNSEACPSNADRLRMTGRKEHGSCKFPCRACAHTADIGFASRRMSCHRGADPLPATPDLPHAPLPDPEDSAGTALALKNTERAVAEKIEH